MGTGMVTGGTLVVGLAPSAVDQGLSTTPNTVAYSATPNFNLGLSSTQIIQLTGNASATATNPVNGQVYLFFIMQDSVGGRAWSWPAGFINAGLIDTGDGTATANTFCVQSFIYLSALNKYFATTPMLTGVAQ